MIPSLWFRSYRTKRNVLRKLWPKGYLPVCIWIFFLLAKHVLFADQTHASNLQWGFARPQPSNLLFWDQKSGNVFPARKPATLLRGKWPFTEAIQSMHVFLKAFASMYARCIALLLILFLAWLDARSIYSLLGSEIFHLSKTVPRCISFGCRFSRHKNPFFFFFFS